MHLWKLSKYRLVLKLFLKLNFAPFFAPSDLGLRSGEKQSAEIRLKTQKPAS